MQKNKCNFVKIRNIYLRLIEFCRYYDETVSVFKKLTELQPNVVAHWINLGTIYTDYNIKKYDQARECFKKALTLNPSQKEKDKITLILNKIQGK